MGVIELYKFKLGLCMFVLAFKIHKVLKDPSPFESVSLKFVILLVASRRSSEKKLESVSKNKLSVTGTVLVSGQVPGRARNLYGVCKH